MGCCVILRCKSILRSQNILIGCSRIPDHSSTLRSLEYDNDVSNRITESWGSCGSTEGGWNTGSVLAKNEKQEDRDYYHGSNPSSRIRFFTSIGAYISRQSNSPSKVPLSPITATVNRFPTIIFLPFNKNLDFIRKADLPLSSLSSSDYTVGSSFVSDKSKFFAIL